MTITLFPILLIILGLLLWLIPGGPKRQEAGKICFFCGLLVLTWVFARHMTRIG
jgi:hypothetical protein